MTRSVREHLGDALTHIDALTGHASRSDIDAEIVVDACALRLSAAIDAVSQVPNDLRSSHIDEPEWRTIRGMRNRIAHAYAIVDPAVVRQTIADDVAGFRESVSAMLASVDSPTEPENPAEDSDCQE